MGDLIYIESNRVKLSPVTLSDAPTIYFVYACDPRTSKYMPWEAHKDIEETVRLVTKWTDPDNQSTYLAVRNKGNLLIGVLSIKPVSPNVYCVGYCYGVKYWHYGYATEALSAVIDYMFNYRHANAIIAYAMETNTASTNVLRKCGMTKVVHDEYVTDKVTGHKVPKVKYAITANAYTDMKKLESYNKQLWWSILRCFELGLPMHNCSIIYTDEDLDAWLKTGTKVSSHYARILRKLYSIFDRSEVKNNDQHAICPSLNKQLGVHLVMSKCCHYAAFAYEETVLLAVRSASSALLFTNRSKMSEVFDELNALLNKSGSYNCDAAPLVAGYLTGRGHTIDTETVREVLELVRESNKSFSEFELRNLVVSL